MRDSHQVHVAELGAALAPVSVGENVMTADFAPRFDLAVRRHSPVEQRVVTRDTLSGSRWLHVLEESRESSDHFAIVERARDAQKFIVRDPGFFGALAPRVGMNLVDLELAFERGQHFPFGGSELYDIGVDHATRFFAARAWLDAATSHVSDSKREQTPGRHHPKPFGTDFCSQKLAVTVHGETDRNLESRPQPINRSRRRGISRSDDDMSGEGILSEHELER